MKTTLFRTCVVSLLAMGAVGFVSCSDDDDDDDAQPGKIGDIQVDRQRIGTCQPFTLSCKAALGTNVFMESIDWVGENGISHEADIKDGVASYTTFVKEPGKVTYSCVYRSTGANTAQYEMKKDIVLDIVASDIRNSFWGDNVSETLNNIRFYYYKDAEVKDNKIIFAEKEEAMHMTFETPRTVRYDFENDALVKVAYIADLSKSDKNSMIKSLMPRLEEMKRNQGFTTPFEYGYIIEKDQALSPAEQELAEAFKNEGINKDFDKDGVLANAVAEGRVALLISGDSPVSHVSMDLSKREEGVYFCHWYSPLKK